MSKVEIKIKGDSFKLYIDNLLHVHFNLSDFIGLQSWKNGKNWYNIEYTLKDSTILTNYENIELWKEILMKLDNYL